MSATLHSILSALHLLRPHWLWALLLLPLLGWLWRRRQRHASVWQGAVDAHLLPHLLAGGHRREWPWTALVAALAYVLAIVAMAGPSWRQTSQPLWQGQAPLVVALDLSSAMTASDLPPSRLAQARAKLAVLLRERRGGQIGLLAFADDAYTVAPLTDDAANVALFVDALTPDVMPVDGHRPDRAIDRAVKLMQQAGFARGDILLLTHQANDQAFAAARKASDAGYRVLVLGLGTAAGAAYRSPDGSIRQTRMEADALRRLARSADGRYAALSAGPSDLDTLGVLQTQASDRAGSGEKRGSAWQDEGYWLLPPLMLLALLLFRRRPGALVLLLCLSGPWQAAQAADWWLRDDQRAHRQLMQGVEAYRRGDFAAAANAFGHADSADAHYNRGNALAKAKQYPQAIQAYDEALRREPGMADALANKRAVEAAMKRQPPAKGGQSSSKPQSEPGSSQSQPQSSGDGDGQGKADAPAPEAGTRPPSPAQPPSSTDKPDPAAGAPPDARTQQAADAAQRQRMQQALKQAREDAAQGKGAPTAASTETPAQRERRQANDAWLRRVPDDPGGLLREKFRIEHERRQQQGGRGE